MKKWKIILGILILALIIFISYVLSLKPVHDKDWEVGSEILPTIEQEGDIITIKNVRDFIYDDKDILEQNYIDMEIDINKLEGMHFVIEPFADWDAVAHSFFTFEIEGQDPVSFSVEARKEKTEPYSAFQGLFNKYELWYNWGTERLGN